MVARGTADLLLPCRVSVPDDTSRGGVVRILVCPAPDQAGISSCQRRVGSEASSWVSPGTSGRPVITVTDGGSLAVGPGFSHEETNEQEKHADCQHIKVLPIS